MAGFCTNILAGFYADIDNVDGAGVLQPMPLPGKVYNMG
jgi:hypothetical protein